MQRGGFDEFVECPQPLARAVTQMPVLLARHPSHLAVGASNRYAEPSGRALVLGHEEAVEARPRSKGRSEWFH